MQIIFKQEPQIQLGEREKAIIGELRRGDRMLCELKDALGWSYVDLDKELEKLRRSQVVEYYFAPYMVWRLVAR